MNIKESFACTAILFSVFNSMSISAVEGSEPPDSVIQYIGHMCRTAERMESSTVLVKVELNNATNGSHLLEYRTGCAVFLKVQPTTNQPNTEPDVLRQHICRDFRSENTVLYFEGETTYPRGKRPYEVEGYSYDMTCDEVLGS